MSCGKSTSASQQVLIVSRTRIGALDDRIPQIACGGELTSVSCFRLYDRCLDQIVPFHLNDQPRIIFELHEKVWVVSFDRVRIGVDVLDVEVRLSVREHPYEIDLLNAFVRQ
jgi:hypothetical protein